MADSGGREERGRAELHFTAAEAELLDRARGAIERQPFCRQAAVWIARRQRKQPDYQFDIAIPARGAWQKERRKVLLSFNVVFRDAEQRRLVNQARGALTLSGFVYAASLTYARLILDFNQTHGVDD